MSFSRENEPIHNKVHSIELDDGCSYGQAKNLNIMVKRNQDGALLIKLRDEKNLLFNYTSVINRTNFLAMKKDQSLDIDFDEFEKHLLEMLLLHLSKEMLMKCEMKSDESKCQVIFYEKSKIKNLILLSIEMTITSQKDLFEEMETNMRILQDTNRGLNRQIKELSEELAQKGYEISESRMCAAQLQQKFGQDMQTMNRIFLYCLGQCETLLTEKVLQVSSKIVKIISDINIVKNENYSKSESNTRLSRKMDKMRTENLENLCLIDKLKLENATLEKLNRNLENDIYHLTTRNKENEKKISELQDKITEYREDLSKSVIAIAKKTEQYDELKLDMEQANQVIRNYNKHYDSKAQEVEELIDIIKSKDELIKEQLMQNNQIFKEFHEYKMKFNSEETEKLMMDLNIAEDKIKTLEKEKREMVKLNGLLTKKISSSSMFSEQRS